MSQCAAEKEQNVVGGGFHFYFGAEMIDTRSCTGGHSFDKV